MNNPLRYAGLTYYQASFDGEHTTILEVVRNPSWLVPTSPAARSRSASSSSS
jgi:hypothetical protein